MPNPEVCFELNCQRLFQLAAFVALAVVFAAVIAASFAAAVVAAAAAAASFAAVATTIVGVGQAPNLLKVQTQVAVVAVMASLAEPDWPDVSLRQRWMLNYS